MSHLHALAGSVGSSGGSVPVGLYTHLQTITLSSHSFYVEFSSSNSVLPWSGFSDLELWVHAKTTDTSTAAPHLAIRMHGQADANEHVSHEMNSYNGGARNTSASTVRSSYGKLGQIPPLRTDGTSNANSNAWGHYRVKFPFVNHNLGTHGSTAKYKKAIGMGNWGGMYSHNGGWSHNSVVHEDGSVTGKGALTMFQIICITAGNFYIGSKFSLYGIRESEA